MVTPSRLKAKHRLRAFTELVFLSSLEPEVAWAALLLGRRLWGDGHLTITIGPIGKTADERLELLREGRDRVRWAEDRSHSGFPELWDALTEQRTRMVALAREGTDAPAAFGAMSEMAVLCARRKGPDGVSRWSRDLEIASDERFTGLR